LNLSQLTTGLSSNVLLQMNFHRVNLSNNCQKRREQIERA
jgi:hypothetical protein